MIDDEDLMFNESDDIDVEIHWQVSSTTLEFDGDYDVDTITVEEFTERGIKAAVEKYLCSDKFEYRDIGKGAIFGSVYFTVQVQPIPYYSDRNTLFAGTYIDGVVDWDDDED